METRGEWMRLRDELPPKGVNVLVTDGEGIVTAELSAWTFHIHDFYSIIQERNITHWMKMPQLPSKEEIQHERDAA